MEEHIPKVGRNQRNTHYKVIDSEIERAQCTSGNAHHIDFQQSSNKITQDYLLVALCGLKVFLKLAEFIEITLKVTKMKVNVI